MGQNLREIKTQILLTAPSHVGVDLVPLRDVEDSEFSFFYSAVFLGMATTMLGALISLVATDYDNMPVLYFAAFSFVVFLVFFIVFSLRGFKIRAEARREAREQNSFDDEHFSPEFLRDQSVKFIKAIDTHVFMGRSEIPVIEYEIGLRVMINEFSKKEMEGWGDLIGILLNCNILEQIESEDGIKVARFNKELDIAGIIDDMSKNSKKYRHSE